MATRARKGILAQTLRSSRTITEHAERKVTQLCNMHINHAAMADGAGTGATAMVATTVATMETPHPDGLEAIGAAVTSLLLGITITAADNSKLLAPLKLNA